MSQRSNHLPKLLANVCMVPFKESGQFLFLCKPCVVYSMFPHITQKILTTDTFHWLALIPNSQLSYRYSVWEKQPLGFLKTSENLRENNKKIVFLSFFIFHFFYFTFISLWSLRDTFNNIVWFDFIANRIQFHYNFWHKKLSLNCKR